MEIADFVIEAMETAGGPAELWPLRNNFFFDPYANEWCFDGYFFTGAKSRVNTKEWVHKICDWLAVKYPCGPEWRMEASCA